MGVLSQAVRQFSNSSETPADIQDFSYGVSRVYSQQCGYVLADAQSAQNNLLQLLRVTRTSELDPEAGRTTRSVFVTWSSVTFNL